MEGIERPLKLYCAKNQIFFHSNNKSITKSKYIDIKFLVARERVQSGKMSIEHTNTNSKLRIHSLKVYHLRSFMSILLIWVLYQLMICNFSGSSYSSVI